MAKKTLSQRTKPPQPTVSTIRVFFVPEGVPFRHPKGAIWLSCYEVPTTTDELRDMIASMRECANMYERMVQAEEASAVRHLRLVPAAFAGEVDAKYLGEAPNQ